MALLRPGRCCSRHRVAACSIALKLSGSQRNSMRAGRPRSQVIRNSMRAGRPRSPPALPGDAAPAVRWGVSGGRLLRKPTCTLWETPVCPRAGPPPCRADHSRKNGRSLMKTQWTRMLLQFCALGVTQIDRKTGAPPSTTAATGTTPALPGDKGQDAGGTPALQFCALGVTMSWDERASRERGRPARTKPGTASAISPTWINRERRHGSPSAWPLRFPPTGWLPAASH